ncbi:MAG: acyltransferase [Lawsonibacter sp.]|jgi:peptidoglycan/LPS O-acetylase OafA/YrhL
MTPINRKTELPWLNLLFCAMVLWSHCSAHPITHLDPSGWQYALVYLLQRLSYVSVYGFFLLSGIKLTLPRSHPTSLSRYYWGRIKSIFLPYMLAVALYYLWFSQYLLYFPLSWRDFGGYLLRGDLSSHFYFVIALAQFVALAPLFQWLSRRWAPAILLPFALGITWLSAQYLPDLLRVFWPSLNFRYADRVFTTYFFYYLAGCYIGRHYEAFLAALRTNALLIWSLFILFSGGNLLLCWLNYSGRRPVPFLEQIHMLYLLSAILACFLVATYLPKTLPKWLQRIDKASYLIYLYHCLAISYFDYHAALSGGGRVSILFILRVLFVYTATPLISVLWQSLWTWTRTHFSPHSHPQ